MLKRAVLCKILFAVLYSCAAAGDEYGKSTPLLLTAAEDDLAARCIRESGHPDNAGRVHDFVEMRYVDETPMPSLHPKEEDRGYLVFSRHWMDLVFPNSIPQRREITDKLDAFAARGEYESVTFCVRTLKDIKGLEVKTGRLVSESGDRLAAPEVRIVRCSPRMMQGGYPIHKSETSKFGTFGIMNMPVCLEKARAVNIEAGRTVQYWLTLQADADAVAGVYRGDIEITQEGGKAHELSLTVKVFPITLLEPTVTLGFWDLDRRYKGEIGTIADVYKIMSHHGGNTVFTSAGLWQWDPEKSTYDFSRHLALGDHGRVKVTFEGSPLENRMEAAKRAGFKAVCFVPRFDRFVRKAVRKLVDKQTLKQEVSEELAAVLGRYKGSQYYDLIKEETTKASKKGTDYPIFSESYARVYVQILREILKEGRHRGWPEIIVSPGDERFSHHRRGNRTCLPLAIRRLELMKRAGANTTVNQLTPALPGEYGVYSREALRFSDIMMGGSRQVQPEVVQDLANLGITTYSYNMNIYHGAMTPDLSAARFGAGYFFETIGDGVEGEFECKFFLPQGDPYNPLDDMYYWHEVQWFFPPREAAGRLGGPAISLAARREGVDDLRYLQTLDALTKQAQAKTDSPDAQQAVRAAMTTRRRITGSFDFTTMIEEGATMAPTGAWRPPDGMRLIGEAPKFWMFRTDPDKVGQTEKWFAPSTKGEPWIAISTHDYWEGDHIGDGWYAVDLVIPYVQGKRIWLQFGAVDENYTLWINGEYVGDNLDAGTAMWDQPVSVEISDQFKEGQSNHVVVRVRNTDAAGGIWKPVRVLVEQQEAITDAADTQMNVLDYNQTLYTLIEQKQWPPSSRWDTLVASPGVEPVIKGSYRLHNGWDFETYDRNRRDIAEAIIIIQEALAQ